MIENEEKLKMFPRKLIAMSLAFWLAMFQGALSIGKLFFYVLFSIPTFLRDFHNFFPIPCWLITVFGIAPYLALSWEEFHYTARKKFKSWTTLS